MGIFIKENLKLHFLVYFQNRKIPCDNLISFINIGEICFWFSFLFMNMPFSEENELLKQTFYFQLQEWSFFTTWQYYSCLCLLKFHLIMSGIHIMHFSMNFMFSQRQIRKGNLYLEVIRRKSLSEFFVSCVW